MPFLEGWTHWTHSDGPYRPHFPPPEPAPAPEESADAPFEAKPIDRQISQIIRETLGERFPDAFQALLDAFRRYADLGFSLRC